MNEHALDAMIYAWQVLKEKEENKMIGVYAGRLTNINIERKSFMGVADTAVVKMEFASQDICDYDKLTIRDDEYSLVSNKDIITTNDELLKLREKVAELEEELTEIKTARALREAYVKGVEKGCESLREERDRWKKRFGSVVTDLSKSLEANGIEFKLKGINGDAEWGFIIDIPELNEAKKKVEDLEKKLADAKDHGDYWLREHDVKTRMYQELEQKHDAKWTAMCDALKAKGVEVIYMGEEDGKPIVDVKIPKLDELLKESNARAHQIDILRKDFEDLNAKYINRGSKIECLELDLKDSKNKDNKYEKLFIEATNMKDYWYSTYYEAVRQSWNQGVSIRINGANLKDNVGIVQVNNKRAEELKKELEELKSKKVATCTLEAGADGRLKFIYTYMDGHNEAAHINRLCKNHVAIDAESISCGTVPNCKSCAHYMHNPSRWAHDWCYMPLPKEGGAGYIRKLSKIEAEGPACSDFKARKE